jgi:hypothetical protein
LRFLEPVKVLLLKDEAIRRFSDQIIISVKDLSSLVHLSDNFESTPEIPLLDLVHAILVILVGELVHHGLPFLEQFGGCRHQLHWKLVVLVLAASHILSDRSSHLARLQMLLSDWQMVKSFEHTVNDLDRGIRAIGVLRYPHLQEATALQLEEYLFDVFLPEQLSHLLQHFESVESLSASLDGLDIEETCLMHPLHKVDRDSFGLLLEILVTLQCLFSSVGSEFMAATQLSQQ